MPLPVHHLKHLHHRVKHFLSRRLRSKPHRHSGEEFATTPESADPGCGGLTRMTSPGQVFRQAQDTEQSRSARMTSRIGVLIIAAALILMPLALSPVSSDPAMAGQTALLLVATSVLYLILAVRSIGNTGSSRHCEESAGEAGESAGKDPSSDSGQAPQSQIATAFGLAMTVIKSVLRPPSSVLLALVLTLIMILTSANPTVALASPQAKVVLVLLFFLAAKKLIRGNLDRDRSLDSARDDRCGQIASEALAMTKSGYTLIKKAWLSGLIVFGLLYLIFASPLALRAITDSRSRGAVTPGVLGSTWKVAQVAQALVAPQFNPIRPDWQTSLKVASETLVHSPLLGAGFGHYASAFTSYRGAGFNSSPLWNTKISTSFSTLFNWVTEGGVVGIVVYALLFLPGFVILLATTKKIIGVIPSRSTCSRSEPVEDLSRDLPRMRARTSLPAQAGREILRRGLLRMTEGILAPKTIVVGLTAVSLFFPFSLVGYFYLITGYLFIYEN